MSLIKSTVTAIAATMMVGSVATIAAPSQAEAGNRVFNKSYTAQHRFKANTDYYPNKHGCRDFQLKYNHTGDRYWLGEYYRCLHRFDDKD
ncbi:MAG: hypothetical protein AAF468_04555 [Pseudomonadota bacterium]